MIGDFLKPCDEPSEHESERSEKVWTERERIGGDGKTGRENISMASERPEKRRSMDAVHASVRAKTL